MYVETPSRALDQTFTYLSTFPLQKGMRVKVPFGAMKERVAFVANAEYTTKNEAQIKEEKGFKNLFYVQEAIDEDCLLNEELFALADWMKKTTLSSLISCYQTMLPQKMKPASGNHKPVQVRCVRCVETEAQGLTPKQEFLFQKILSKEITLAKDARNMSQSAYQGLLNKGYIEVYTKDKEAKEEVCNDLDQPKVLTVEQEAALREIEGSTDAVYLLRGVTGSGKTEIYLQLAQKEIEHAKQVLILVPEIALTPQMKERVLRRFGTSLAMYHSGLNAQEKYEQYMRVKNGQAKVVVGTRSAVFLPFQNLGLIVLDEEHDSSYKQSNQPCYHCRDVAIWRGAYHRCKVILGSATPSLESYARGIKNVYHLVELKNRVNQSLPKVTTVEMKTNLQEGNRSLLTDPLKEALQKRLDANEQSILLLNRRGYSRSIRCKACAKPVYCPHCDIAMSYHLDSHTLRCHTCGISMPVPRVCPVCKESRGFFTTGYGTERLESELQTAFPEARILRMDRDTTLAKGAHEKILRSFGNKEADILIGTQMIAKGLDYPSVTLVGILNADDGLARLDYRSAEVTFDYLCQASGRSGRSDKCGEVIFQVYEQQDLLTLASKQDYLSFFEQEMQFRHAGMYPPYTYMISLTASGKNQDAVNKEAQYFYDRLNGSYKKLGVLSLLKIKDQYRARVILKGADMEEMRNDVQNLLSKPETRPYLGIHIDVNPLEVS